MLQKVLFGVVLLKLDHKLIAFRLEHECNQHEVVAQLGEEACAAFVLEHLELIKIFSKLICVGFAGGSMRSNLFPNTVDVSNFVGQQFIVTKASHQVHNLSVGAHGEDP